MDWVPYPGACQCVHHRRWMWDVLHKASRRRNNWSTVTGLLRDTWSLVESLNCTLCRMNMITKNALNGSQICQIASFAVLFCLTFHPGGLGQSPLVLVLVASGCQCRASMSIKLCFTLKTYYGTILDHPTLIDPCWLAGRVESYAIRPPVNPVFRHFSPLSRSIQAPRPIEPRA